MIRWVFCACFFLGILLACVPLTPWFPQPSLDAAWCYAMNQAVADRMVFGRDIIFTFGPYACVVTHQYHPATDGLMLAASTLMGSAVAVGALSLASRGKILYLVPLPVLVACVGCDALFFAVPFLFLIVAVRLTLPADHRWKLLANWRVAVSLAIMSLALGLLPLIKATHSLMVVFVSGLGWLLILRWRRAWGLILGAIFVTGLVSFWLIAKQPLSALPGFFVAQVPMVSGYSEAMSIPGPPADWAWYGASAALILLFTLLCFARDGGLPGKVLCVGLALSLFLAFKAAFVRHDAHAMIAADFALLVSFLLSINLPHGAAAAIVVCSVAGWLPAIEHYYGVNGKTVIVSRSSQIWEGLLSGVRVRLAGSQNLHEQFEAARARIRQENPLPRVDGDVDIYPSRQDIVLANELRWAPRPIIQSYSAYEPVLAVANARHLLSGSSPQHIFFEVGPIDGRLAALEDGASWPLLLTRYHLGARAEPFLVAGAEPLLELDRNPDVTSGPKMEDISTSVQRLGKEFPLPKVSDPLWAEIVVKPTFLGRFLGALFKPSELHILFRYEDGHTENFRYVACMGQSGFIISPVIHKTGEFAALLTQRRELFFSGARPVSVKITDDSGTHLFWKRAFNVHFQRVDVPVQPQADALVFNQWISNLALNQSIAGSGECSIDVINGKRVTGQPVTAKDHLIVQGWAAVSPEKGIAADNVFVRMASDDGSLCRTARARAVPRPDVNAYFKHPEMGAAGFEAVLDTAEFKGKSTLQVYVERDKRVFTCPTTVEIRND